MTQTTPHTPGAEPPYPSEGYAWYVVIILMLAYVFAYLDRFILTLMVEPIKRDLGITDTQMSLVLGLAFAIFYTVLGIPIGRLADHKNRRTIMAVGIAVWSVMTAACGLAKNFFTLFLARVGVGIGEATLQPCATSILSDYFPRGKRGLAYSVYAWGLGLGAGAAMILGGRVIEAISKGGMTTLPIVGEVFPWQVVFFAIGLPGVVVAVLMMTVAEPLRRDLVAGQTAQAVPFSEVMSYIGKRWRTFGSHFLGLSVMTFIGNAYVFWLPSVFIRTHGWTVGEVSFWYGLILGLGGPIGVTMAGLIGDRMYKAGQKDGHMRAALYGTLILIPVAIIVPLIPDPKIAMALMIIHSIGSGMPTAAGPAALMMIAPNNMRGQITALYWFVISGIGLGLGPLSVALLTDKVFGTPTAVGTSLAIVSAVAGGVVSWVLFFNLKHYRGTVEETERMIASR
ncbi:MAG: MFS transporter [Rhodospirillaceae bacterium]|nr:MFS transporter [Rhodospirillaceae bacterium]